jgi:hypothetical protein
MKNKTSTICQNSLMKKLTLLIIVIMVSACSEVETDSYLKLQSDHLEKSVIKSLKDFETEVYNTGQTETGSTLLKRAKELYNKLEVIKSKHAVNEIKTLSSEFIYLSRSTIEPIDLPTDFLEESIQSLTESNLIVFNSNLSLYLLETINTYHKTHSNRFAMFDLVSAFVDSDDNVLKSGSTFHAETGLEAASSALHPQIFVKFEGQDGFVPLNVSNKNNRAEITIGRPHLGKNRLQFKVLYISPQGEKEIQIDHEFQVIQ